MSIKKLFESTHKVQDFVSNATSKELFTGDGESQRNIESKITDQKRYVPQIDYSKPENFVKYGSARLYYKSALTRIVDYYPYDGSQAEINDFLNGCLDVERYVLDNKYPRSTGYIQLGYGKYAVSSVQDGYGVPTANEYIALFGGPGTGSASSLKLKDLLPNSKNSKYNYSNIYDETIYATAQLPSDYGLGTRTSNLKSNFDNGVTVEFWMKTGSFESAEIKSITNKQVIFDLWNQTTDSTDARMLIELTSSHADLTGVESAQRPFLITVQSGSHTTKTFLSLGQTELHSSSGDWNHYAIRMYNTGSNFKADLYVNGYLNDSAARMPYDLASNVKPTTDGVIGWLSSSAEQERSWPHALQETYSSSRNLQGWWRGNSNPATGVSGKEVPDASGNARHGTATNLPTLDVSQPSAYISSNSYNFDGTNDNFDIGTAATWNSLIGKTADGGTAQMTFAAWINIDAVSGAGNIFNFGTNIKFQVVDVGGIKLSMQASWDSSVGRWNTTSTVATGEWIHVAVTYNANSTSNNPSIYVNGIEVAISEAVTPAGAFNGILTHNCFVGTDRTLSDFFDGKMADMAVWNSTLTANEIKSIYSAYLIKSTTNTVGELGPLDLQAWIGALQTTAPGSSGPKYAGRLSGSLDEFRFWKTKRTAAQIGKNWFGQVRGGANSDISNTTLGVYYKFNEGITGDADTDRIILDYAGRVTNGFWTGYSAGTTGPRNTGSAMVSSSAAHKEFLDPIIRTNHPDYISLQSMLLETGSMYDYQNSTSLYNLAPSWILQEADETDNTDLKYITHVMGTYFDKLYAQINDLPKLRHQTHTSGTFKPISFAEHLPQSLGLYSPEIFIDSSVLERFMNHSGEITFENEINDAKNLIYQNLYNNLTDIYKSKGTEQAVKNVLKCFNIDDKLLKLKINSNNTEFVLKNNLQQHLVTKNLADFSNPLNHDAVIYQSAHDSQITASAMQDTIPSTLVAGSVTGSTFQYGHGFTLESNVYFPSFDPLESSNSRLRTDLKEVSLFGTFTVDGTDSDNSMGRTGVAGALDEVAGAIDYGNFKFTFLRDEVNSKNGSFRLKFYNPDASAFGLLESPVFNNVYDNEMWNLSVRVKPKNYPLQTFVSGTFPGTGGGGLGGAVLDTYEIIFSGYKAVTTDIFDSFSVSHETTTEIGKKFILSGKRVFAGAHRNNVLGGTVVNLSDVMISSVAYWPKYIEEHDLKQHALDIENVGVSGSAKPLAAIDLLSNNYYQESLGNNLLALNWNFREVADGGSTTTLGTTTKIAPGQGIYTVEDFSSGSFERKEKFGWAGIVSGQYYLAMAHMSGSTPFPKKKLNSYKFTDPERPVSSDMVQIFSDEDDLAPNLKRQEILPNFVYSLEKSLYDAISEEILDFFAGVIDFNNVIGHPVQQYRHRYKEIEKLRDVFFRRVRDRNTVEKYSEYYKWFDNAITTIISQLMPASAEYINSIQNVVESHVLERNKYQNRLGIFDQDKYSIERVLEKGTPLAGVGDPSFWTFLAVSSPEPSSPRNTHIHYQFWKQRADRTAPEITSGDAIIDTQRNKFRDIIYTDPTVSGAAEAPILSTVDGEIYRPSAFIRKGKSAPVRLNAAAEDAQYGKIMNADKVYTRAIKGGTNFESIKNFDLAASIVRPAGPISRDGGPLIPLNVMIGFVSESVKIPFFKDLRVPSEKILKQKKTFKVNTGRDWEEGLGYKNIKSGMIFPFNVYSSSVEVNSGYNTEVVSRVGKNLMITNIHNDVYGEQLERPMQGPFTNDVVGGHQSRHIDINTGTDQQNNRPEAWRILLGTCDMVPSGAIGVVGPDYPPANAPLMSNPYPFKTHEKAYLYRDFIAKRPVNIKNINQRKNNKTVPGNYIHQYELVYSFGARNNPRAFVENQPTLPQQLQQVNSTTNVRTFFDIHRGQQSHFQFVDDYNVGYLTGALNKNIIVSRFSAPGGIECQSLGFKDFRSSEMSVYNTLSYKNLTVIKPSQGPSGTISEDPGGTPSTMRARDIHNKDYGLNSHYARHSAKFGRDPLYVSDPGVSTDELPSFHKINRNTRQVIVSTDINNTTFATGSKFDNFYVQRPIPQSDRQYLWLSNSVEDVSNIKYAGYQRTQGGSEFDPYRSSSSGYESYWSFVTASSATTGSHFQPTNELNIIVQQPVDIDTNTLGYPSDTDVSNYTNFALVGETPNSNYLNHLLTSRGSKYGWGWNKFHQQNNRILIKSRRANRLAFPTGALDTLTSFDLRPVSLKGRSSYINFDVITPDGSSLSTENVTLKFTNTNEKIFFNDLALNNLAEINYARINEPYKDALAITRSDRTTLNWFLYRQNIFPSLKNEFDTFTGKRVGYDNKFWRDNPEDRTTRGSTLSSSVAGAIVSKSCWALDAPQNFLTRTSIFGTSGSGDIPFNSMLYFTSSTFVPLTGAAAYNMTVPAGGELQNTYFSYFNIYLDGGKYATMQIAPLYARKHVLGTPHSVVSPGGVKIPETGSIGGVSNTGWDLTKQVESFAGEALWEAGTQAGIVAPGNKPTGSADGKILTATRESVFIHSASKPWYNDYDAFNSDLKLLAKGYSVVPEYRMSEHVKEYTKYGINNPSKTDLFEIVGTNSSSADRNFYIDYSNSDFLENFLGIKAETLMNAKEIKLTCNAAIKYNPYKGFYPAQRTVDLAAQFADSFKDSVQGSISGSSEGITPFNNKSFGHETTLYERAGGIMKLLLDPMISPGILYNSIKSGIAVDYPIVSTHSKRLRRPYGVDGALTGSTNNWALSITGSTTVDLYISGSGEYVGGQYWDKRIPFEAIIEPRKYILNTDFIDMESHPSMSLDWAWGNWDEGPDLVYEKEAFTASYGDNADGIYTSMARNFFGAVGEFFLESSGITKLESNTVLDDLQFTKDSNFAGSRPLYMARIKLRKSHNGARTYDKEYDSYGGHGTTLGSSSYYGINGAKRTTNGTQSIGQYPLPQDPMRNEMFKETFTMYSRPTAFGPPCAGRPTGSNAIEAPFNFATRDSFSGFNPAFTPPYYDGEAWCDLVFRPHVVDKTDSSTATLEPYDLNRILNEIEVVCWRFDSGEERQVGDSTKTASMPVLIPIEQTQFANFIGQTPGDDHTVPSIYDGKRININSMQLTSSVNVFGTKKVFEQEVDKFGRVIKTTNKQIGSKWIIQPKWETPMLNFNDDGVHKIKASAGTLTLPTYGSASVPRGMWHQFGVIPDDPNKGIFLEITDIPETWLKNHYEVLTGNRETAYNGNAYGTAEKDEKRINLYKNVRSLSSLCGFDKTNSIAKLGQIKESLAVHEAVVAIPYVIEEVAESIREDMPVDSELRKTRKKFISIPKRRFGSARESEEGSPMGDSLTTAGESIRKLKQNMEKFVFPPEFDFLHNKEVDPVAMYVFEFKYEFDRDDLSYIWQNLAPRDHEKATMQKSSVSHNLADNELISEEILHNNNLRWMVFKVKQRAQTDYYDLVADQANESTRAVEEKTTDLPEYKFGFNWPYDYLSFIELIKMDVDILLKK